MIVLVFLDAKAVFTHIIVGTLLAFVTGAHNGEQITFITPAIRQKLHFFKSKRKVIKIVKLVLKEK